MSDMVPEVLNAALDSLFTPKEPGEQEYQGEDGPVSYTHLDVYKRQILLMSTT